MTITTTTRNATLEDLSELLQDQHGSKLDLVVPATAIRSIGGQWVVQGAEWEPTVAGGEPTMMAVPGTFTPTVIADEHVAEKLGIPLPYLRRLRTERSDLYDGNVNGWLHGRRKRVVGGTEEIVHPADDRKFLLRTFRGGDGPGVARALLSDRFRTIDNLDVLVAVLDGVRQTGTEVHVDGCDLSDRRMYVRIVAPGVAALAPVLLNGYRSPWNDGNRAPWDTEAGRAHGWMTPDQQPVVFAGFVIANSEVGGGAFTITPRLMVRACKNGLTITLDALREVHLGGRLDEGVVKWSEDTNRRALELVTAKARDAVATFLDPAYVEAKLAEMTAKAGAPVGDPANAVKVVATRLRMSDAVAKDVLNHFILGGQPTVGGIMQAVSSVAQTVADADLAADLEADAVKVLDMAWGIA